MPAVSAADLLTVAPSEPSAIVRARVEAARQIQADRYGALGLAPTTLNAHCSASLVERVAAPTPPAPSSCATPPSAWPSRPALPPHPEGRPDLADLAGSDTVGRPHLAEAISYRVATERPAVAG